MQQLYKIILAFFIGVTISTAQPVTSVKYDMMIDVAQKAADEYDYYNAIEWFNKAYRQSKDKGIKVAIGDLYMKLRNYERAERSYGIVLKRDKDLEYVDVVLDFVDALKYQGKYKAALETLRNFSAGVQNDSLKSLALAQIKSIEAIEGFDENIDIVISFIEGDVNSGSGENSPYFSDEGELYYSSFNRRSVIDTKEKEEDYHAGIYSAKKKEDGTYGDPIFLDEVINRKDFHTSGVSMSKDGRIMYFTRIQLEGNEIVESEIYSSRRLDDGWAGAQPIASVNGEYLALHPYEGELYGEKVLFFTSDMDGGQGGYDLYYARITGDGYGTPVNLGASVNTAANEITPSYQDGVFYYSSDAEGGLGGYDIYRARWSGEKFEDVENMGGNYNSSVDDTYFRMSRNGKSGYLVSNRADDNKKKLKGSATCCDDIYAFQKQEIVIDLLAKIMDENGALDGATVELVDLSMPLETGGEVKTSIQESEFNFLLTEDHEYMVKVSREGYFPDSSVVFNTAGIIDNMTIEKSITLAKDPNYGKNNGGDDGGETQVVNTNEAVRLSNIYYEFGKADILQEAEEDLAVIETLLKEYPEMVIELSSHTDSRGKSPFNKALSQRRADSAKNWLVNRGIDPNRIKAVGYGESVLLNRCANGVRCSEEEHAINRRTEFKILEGPEQVIIRREKKVKYNIFDKYDDEYNGSQNSVKEPVPLIKFVENDLDLGTIIKGEQKEVVFYFVNAGDAPLHIRTITSCKCTELDWPEEDVKPGDQGYIRVVFDTTDQDLGEVNKTVNIIANTNPIVVEAFFKAIVVKAK